MDERYQIEESRLVRILEAITLLKQSPEWSTLKTEVFESLQNKLERELFTEAKKQNPDTNTLARIAGQLEWAEKYADLSKMENKYWTQLQGIRQQLNESD